MTAVAEKISETSYWSPTRINRRIDSYVMGVEARITGQTLGVNPYKVELAPEQWKEWREGWLDGRGYETGKLRSVLINEK